PAACHLRRNPKMLARYLVSSVASHLSLVIFAAWAAIVALFSKQNPFPVTGDRSVTPQDIKGKGIFSSYFEFICAVMVSGALVFVCNLSVLPISLATIVGIAVRSLGWEHRAVRALVPLPALSLAVLIICGCAGLPASGGLIPSMMWPL